MEYIILKDIIIVPLTNVILHTVNNHVVNNVEGLRSVKEDLKSIAKDLESITAVLQDAEAKQQDRDTAPGIWLRDLKNVVYDIDDLLDEVATDDLQRSVNKGHFRSKLKYRLSFKHPAVFLRSSHNIKRIREELTQIIKRKNDYSSTNIGPTEAPRVERDSLDACAFVNESVIFGRGRAKTEIIDKLGGLGGERHLSVLPIIGMGGIGKTTLAKLVYTETDQFNKKLWVCVSDNFELRKILQDILKGATEEYTSNDTMDALLHNVRRVLRGKKFLLVLDDMWENHQGVWKKLKDILDVGGEGSVVLITTRSKNVASTVQTVGYYDLDRLSDSDCLCIFKKWAFREGEEDRCKRLCEIGKSIVDKCHGIPLVVQSLGSLLRNERDEEEWLRIRNMSNFNRLDGEYDTVKQIIKLSYDKLPSDIKSCFAHLSLFAKDCVYVPYYHFYCWSALGLLRQSDGIYFNNDFFDNLLSRSMLQDVGWGFDRAIAKFKLHNVLHDLAEDMLRGDLAVVTDNQFSIPESARYISWGLIDKEYQKPIKAKKARAFIFRFQMKSVSQSFLKDIISSMPYLRVLCLGGSHFEELPSSIGKLKHLRFLDLSNNALMKSLPDDVCKLLNLECLLLDRCKQLEEVPSDIYKLVSLRYFSLTTCQKSLVDNKLNSLHSLQHLWLESCLGLVSLWDSVNVGGLTSLRSLQIGDCQSLTSLPNSMKQLVYLKELMISNCSRLDLARGEGLNGLRSLQTLVIERIPQLNCLPGGIQSAEGSLKSLWIRDCQRLDQLPEWLLHFNSLQNLDIKECRNLRSVSQGIRNLNSLQYLKIKGCPHIPDVSPI